MQHILQKHQTTSSCRTPFLCFTLAVTRDIAHKQMQRDTFYLILLVSSLLTATSALRSCESCGQVKNNLSSCGLSALCLALFSCTVSFSPRSSTLPQMPVSNWCYFSRTIKGSLAGGRRLVHLGLCQAIRWSVCLEGRFQMKNVKGRWRRKRFDEFAHNAQPVLQRKRKFESGSEMMTGRRPLR